MVLLFFFGRSVIHIVLCIALFKHRHDLFTELLRLDLLLQFSSVFG